ncbi:MAG TPA: DUF5985 family protein [Verrucomicrobiae bacterium]|jgi:hypothetical protein
MLMQLLAGAITMGLWAIALFFLRFWRRTQDQLFACFALAFFLFGVERLVMFWSAGTESHAYIYLIRLVAFILIVVGIVSKNRASKRKG